MNLETDLVAIGPDEESVISINWFAEYITKYRAKRYEYLFNNGGFLS